METILDKVLNHKQKRIQTVAAKLFVSNKIRLTNAGEIEAAFKIRGILGKDLIDIKRVDYSSDHIVTLKEI
jgi:hypothetical protein